MQSNQATIVRARWVSHVDAVWRDGATCQAYFDCDWRQRPKGRASYDENSTIRKADLGAPKKSLSKKPATTPNPMSFPPEYILYTPNSVFSPANPRSRFLVDCFRFMATSFCTYSDIAKTPHAQELDGEFGATRAFLKSGCDQ
ncbi:hypothetical protein Moror_5239 [Moniliophthora roreri MCA 2997]|uniref:Uncharacterized protein n=1 Tax=Moniliophthora roreri (strain MCA 2997) TaxID=1381753 RepID=V2YBX1_MONRO|nr:hypothetical protein Moror_5239 [Moniliophthora roreri MCA 2997]